MKRRLLLALLAALTVTLCAVGLSACDFGGSPAQVHAHTFSTEWSSNETYHWHAATCEHTEEVEDIMEHQFEQNVCVVCGYERAEELEYVLSNDGTYYIVVGIGTWIDNDVVIPAEYKKLPVKSIAENAFSNSTFTSIVIPDSVTTIEMGAFFACESLTSITIPTAEWINDGNNTYFGYIFGSPSYDVNEDVIPKSLKTVIISHGKSIGDFAFFGCSSLTSIDIPDSVSAIGDGAFSGCSSLTSIDIPDSVSAIGDGAFFGCNLLTSIDIPDSVTDIGNLAFYGCNLLASIDIPGSVTDIGSGAFEYCTGLTDVSIGAGVKTIGDSAFYGCSLLTNIDIPDSVTNIGDEAFSGCSSLTKIAIPDSVTDIGYNVFKDCPIETASVPAAAIDNIPRYNLQTVIITSGESIGDEAFHGCDSLTSIVMPDSVTSIGDKAFYNCSSLKNIDIPKGVTDIGIGAFSGCRSLTNIVIPDGLTNIGDNTFSGCSLLTGIVIPDSITNIGFGAFEYCTGLTDVSIGIGVKTIGNSAFSGCSSLTKIAIPDSVTDIGYNVFKDCPIETASVPAAAIDNIPRYNLQTVIITSGESIGDEAFHGCDSLTSIVMPDSITTIGKWAFHNCSSLTSISIPAKVKSIGEFAFDSCGKLMVHINDIAAWCNIEFKNVSANPLSGSGDLYYNGEKVTELIIPDGVTSIAQYAFWNSGSITSIVIPDSVTSIGIDAFDRCFIENATIPTNAIIHIPTRNLKTLTITSGVNIQSFAFRYCYLLESISIDNVLNIRRNAFESCTSLTNITISNDTTLIEKDAFKDCPIENATIPLFAAEYISKDKLKTVTLTGNYSGYFLEDAAFSNCPSLESVTIGEGVSLIRSYAFSGCTSLKSVDMTDSHVTSITGYAFSSCSSLTDITIADSVTDIGNHAFFGCSSLTSIVIPDSVTEIVSGAFRQCTGLTDVKMGVGLKTIGRGAFAGCSSLTSIVIPVSVTEIWDNAFSGCIELTSVIFENTIGWIYTDNFTSPTNIPSADLTDPAIAANYLTFTYNSGIWSRT